MKQFFFTLLITLFFTLTLIPVPETVFAATKDYTETDVGKKQVYKSGSIKIIISDDVSGETTTGLLRVSRDQAPSFSTISNSATKWNCSLEFPNDKNPHQLSMAQTTVTTKPDIFGTYFVMNFKLKIKHHAYYMYQSDSHPVNGNGFRLNFRSYSKEGSEPISVNKSIVKNDTDETFNWQVNMAAIGLKTIDEFRYTNCKSYLNYTRPSHSITVNPNGGVYNKKTTASVSKKYTGEWFNPVGIPTRDHYIFRGFSCSGSSYVNRSSGRGYSNDLSDKLSVTYDKDGKFSRYSTPVSEKTDVHAVHFNTYSVTAGQTIRISGDIRINSLPEASSIKLYHKKNPTDKPSASGSISKADGTWKHFDISRTFSEASSNAQLDLKITNCSGAIQFDVRNVILTDTGSKKRKTDTNIQIGHGTSSDLTLTAMWIPLSYKITYTSGVDNSTGSVSSQTAHQDETVTLKNNAFKIPDGSFKGWKYKNTTYPQQSIISYDDMTKTPLQKRMADADIMPGQIDKDDIFEMKALWDYKPLLILKNPSVSFMEGEKVTCAKLFDQIKSCTDREDGNLINKVVVDSVTYTKSKTGYQPSNVKMPGKQDLINTYFNHLEKDETVTFSAVFSITDSGGNKVTQTLKIHVLYNYPPEITASSLAYYVRELESDPDSVSKEILENGKASDLEDDRDKLSLIPSIQTPDPFELSKFYRPGTYSVTYYVKDSLGKEATKKCNIHIVDANTYTVSQTKTVRFISKEFLDTLSSDSIWKKNASYHYQLTTSFDHTTNEAKNSYTITCN